MRKQKLSITIENIASIPLLGTFFIYFSLQLRKLQAVKSPFYAGHPRNAAHPFRSSNTLADYFCCGVSLTSDDVGIAAGETKLKRGIG
jgi:hypothetical protein